MRKKYLSALSVLTAFSIFACTFFPSLGSTDASIAVSDSNFRVVTESGTNEAPTNSNDSDILTLCEDAAAFNEENSSSSDEHFLLDFLTQADIISVEYDWSTVSGSKSYEVSNENGTLTWAADWNYSIPPQLPTKATVYAETSSEEWAVNQAKNLTLISDDGSVCRFYCTASVMWFDSVNSVTPFIKPIGIINRATGDSSWKEPPIKLINSNPNIEVKNIVFTENNLTVSVGETIPIPEVKIYPDISTNQTLTYTSDTLKIEDNMFTATEPGSHTLTAAASSGVTAVLKVEAVSDEVKISYLNIRLEKDKEGFSSKNPSLILSDEPQKMVAEISPNNPNLTVTWESDNPSVASISEDGTITFHESGNVVITAACQNMTDTYSIIYLKPAPIRFDVVSPFNINIKEGEKYTLEFTETSTATDLTFTSSDPSVAEVDQKGVITALKEGTASIQISSKAANHLVTRYISFIPSEKKPEGVILIYSKNNINVSETTRIGSAVIPSDAANKALTWSSSDTSVATVDQSGTVKGISAGTAKITAKTFNNKFSSVTVTVENPIEVTDILVSLNTSDTLKPDGSQKLTVKVLPEEAEGVPLTFTSSNPSVATVNQNGLVLAKSIGTANITVSAPNGVKKSLQIYVKNTEYNTLVVPSYLYVKVGETVPIVESYSPSDTIITFYPSSSSGKYYSIKDNYITGIAPTSSALSIKASNGINKVITVVVLEKDLETASYLKMPSQYVKEVNDIFAIDLETDSKSVKQYYTWSSSNSNVASVENGVVTCKKEGSAVITCKAPGELSASTTVYVKKSSSSVTAQITLTQDPVIYINAGESAFLNYTVSPVSEANNVTIFSNNQNVVTVNGDMIYGKAFGTATVYITHKNVKKLVKVFVAPSYEEQLEAREKFASEILYYINIERTKAGLSPLTMNTELSSLAQIRAEECRQKYSHTRPDGRPWYTVFENYSKYTSRRGENLIAGRSSSAKQYVESWMASPSHKANILNPKYRYTGIGVDLYINYNTCTFSANFAAELFTN